MLNMPLSPSPSAKARSWIAILAAYFVALQSLLGAAQAGRALDLAALDREIHLTLCAPGAEAAPQGSDTSEARLPGCCAAACLMAHIAYAPPPPLSIALRFEPSTVAMREQRGSEARQPPVGERPAARPRAPPRMA